MDNLLKCNFLEISEFILSSSLLDVRLEMLKLLYALTDNKDLNENYTKFLTNMRGEDGINKMNYFIGDNLLPDKILIDLNEKEKTKLVNYFNIDNYNKDLDLFWSILSQWLTVKSTINKEIQLLILSQKQIWKYLMKFLNIVSYLYQEPQKNTLIYL